MCGVLFQERVDLLCGDIRSTFSGEYQRAYPAYHPSMDLELQEEEE